MILLTLNEIVEIHQKLIERTGGSSELRDRGLLESAIYGVEASFADVEQYSTVQEKAARLAYALISNHAFVDGNKRVGVSVMLITLRLNEIVLHYSSEELVSLGLDTASGKLKYEEILWWIANHEIRQH